jgi:hypothetical protein
VRLTRIGRCTADRGVVVVRGDAVPAAAALPTGFSHFAPLKGSRADA